MDKKNGTAHAARIRTGDVIMKKASRIIVGLTLALICLLTCQVTAVAERPTDDTVYISEQVIFGGKADACMGAPASDCLSELDRSIYREMVTYIKEVASGSRTSTEFPVATDLSHLSWTASELGCTLVSGGQITEEASNAINQRVSESIHSRRIMDALTVDLPYETYWFDKTVGMNLAFSISGTSSELSVINLRLCFAVSADYSEGGGIKTYATHPQKIAKAAAAVENARAIVAKHAGKSDIAKLEAYRDEICALVTYNNTAANGSLPYGNPWQLIYVFDKDNSTNVVCEGYAKAFKYLCDLSTFSSNVYCYLVSGIMTSDNTSGGHMWNVVEINGKNYLTDVTNVDGNSVGKGNRLFLVGATSSNGGRTHTVSWKTSSFIPSQTTVVYSYYEDEAGLFCDGYLAISPTSYTDSQSKTYTVTVTGGEGSGSYAAGTTVTLIADPAPDGQIFDRWVIESGSVSLSGETAATTTFVMPATDVTIKATYKSQHVHSYGANWITNGTSHWHECACGDKRDTASHSFVWITDKPATEDAEGIRHEACTVCGMTRSENTSIPVLAHTHTMSRIPAKGSTCTEAGNNAYYHCTKCGLYYTNERGTTQTTPSEQALPTAAHAYSSGWKYNADTHWRECFCGAKGLVAAHRHGQTAETIPSCTEAGQKTYACECGQGYTVTIPAPGHTYHSTITKQPTVNTVGVLEYVCGTCGDTYTVDIPKLPSPETEAEVTTTEPETTTTGTEESATEPEVETTEPETTATEPETTATEPETTATEPEATTVEPGATTAEPEVMTTEPEVTTEKPEVEMTEPESTGLETLDLSELLDVGCNATVTAPTILILVLSLGTGCLFCRCKRRKDDV